MQDIQDQIMNMEYKASGTYTGDAIEKAVEVFTRKHVTRKHVRKVAVVITDGESSDKNKLKKAVDEAKAAGILMHAVGVHVGVHLPGADHERMDRELRYIASDPEYIHNVISHSSLAGD